MNVHMPATLAFTVSMLLGNVCMMPMAFAEETQTPQEEYMEMTMTPMVPMSPAYCDYCVKVQSSDGDQAQQKAGCAGHCFSQAQDSRTRTASFHAPNIVAPASMPITVALVYQATSAICPPAMAPPTAMHTDTIILRL